MQKIVDKKFCTGCHACYNICPVNCIIMKPDKEGFLYPVINKQKCIECGKCKSVCPILRNNEEQKNIQAYACINNNNQERFESSSGGIFTLLAKEVLKCNGVVYGAAFDKNFNVEHVAVEHIEDLYKLRGSKYVQSKIGNVFKTIKKQLIDGRTVLFSGTPCQIGGLKTYLHKDYDKLILVDIICHGVPAPLVWKRYVQYYEKKFGSDVVKVNFRHKNPGWNSYSVLFGFSNGTEKTQVFSQDLFMKSFLSNLCLRSSCYDCRFKTIYRQSDITLADFWGVDKLVPEMNDNKGTSLVIVNSEKGNEFFDKITSSMTINHVDITEAIKYNPSAVISPKATKNRAKFLKKVKHMDFEKALNRTIKPNIFKRLISKFISIAKRL